MDVCLFRWPVEPCHCCCNLSLVLIIHICKVESEGELTKESRNRLEVEYGAKYETVCPFHSDAHAAQ